MIETVLGPVSAESLGPTCMHDHLRTDASSLRRDGAAPAPEFDDVRLETLGYLRWNMLASADNLRLDDDELAVDELTSVVEYGQRAVLECSSIGLGPEHARLPDISRRSGVTVLSAYGFYVPSSLPTWVAELSESELEEHLHSALTVAISGTNFRAALLGIMGTTRDFGHREREMLRAAARAAARAGSSASVRLDPAARNGIQVIETLITEGLAAERIVLTNADEYMDAAYWDDLAGTGAVLEMSFGTEAVHVGRVDNPSDGERLRFFGEFARGHSAARHVLGLSTWTKAQLSAYGGYGYAYLFARIAPALREQGLSGARLDEMLVGTPRRLLDRTVN